MTTQLSPAVTVSRLRAVWRIGLAVQLVLSVIAWWLLPGGFPIAHPRFWLNTVLPWMSVGVCALAIAADHWRQHQRFQAWSLAVATFWIALVVGWWLLFPVSSRRLIVPGLLGVAALAGLYFAAFRGRRLSIKSRLCAVLIGGLIGAAAPLANRAPQPSTHPVDAAIPAFEFEQKDQPSWPARFALDEAAVVYPASGAVRVTNGVTIEIEPLLTFQSRSPDRCWTILAPLDFRREPHRRLIALDQPERDQVRLAYGGLFDQQLTVSRAADENTIDIEAFSRLEAPVYSHLNSFAAVLISGHRKLELGFSPCPRQRFEVAPSDYPKGRPIRLAYLDRAGQFHVAQATSGEKGPFETLASGTLDARPLTITVFDLGRALFDIELVDWARQCSRQLSPTAGWGLPMNAIEFSLLGDSSESPAAIWLTLAGTSVGRGWDSVGHTEGVYQSRIRVRPSTNPD